MSSKDSFSSPPAEAGSPTSSSPARSYDPTATRLPLGRPEQVAAPCTPPPPDSPARPEATAIPPTVMPARNANVPSSLAAILVPSVRAAGPASRPDTGTLGRVPDDDTDLPDAFASLGGPRAPERPRPLLDEAAAARAAAMSWPPLEEELDAVEVIDLEVVRNKAMPATGPRAPRIPAGVATFTRPVQDGPAVAAKAHGTESSGGMAWPPPAEDVDAIAMIELQPSAATRGAVALAPVERSRPAALVEVAGAQDAGDGVAPAAPPRRWGRMVGIAVVVASAAGAGYVAVEQRRQVLEPTVSPALSTTGESPSNPVSPLVEPEPVATNQQAGTLVPDASADTAVAAGAAEVGGAAPDPVDATVAADVLFEPRRLLARGDRAGAIRAAMPAASDPGTSRFIASILRGAASATESARAATLSRVSNGESLAAFRAAREQESNATALWRQGQFDRALDLFGRAARSYAAVEAPAMATGPAPVPVGMVGRSADAPAVAARDVTPRVEPALPPVPPTAAGVPVARDTRTTSTLSPPTLEARSVPAPRLDEAGVRRTLEAYRSAFDRLDAPAASALVPSIDGTEIARAFNGLASQRLDFESCDVEMPAATTARATCVGRAASVPKVGSNKPRVDPRRWAFVLERQGDHWQITSAKVTQR